MRLEQNLSLPRCPHCSVATPNLYKKHQLETNNHSNSNHRFWRIYECGNCGGLITASANGFNHAVTAYYPTASKVNDDVPDKPKAYLQQALETIHAPAGSVMLSASAVDAMLKLKGYSEGTLYKRIEKAAEDNLITPDMAKWAHEVRLDANDQRHADEEADLPNAEDAERIIEFASALAEILFVLPKRIRRGLEAGPDG